MQGCAVRKLRVVLEDLRKRQDLSLQQGALVPGVGSKENLFFLCPNRWGICSEILEEFPNSRDGVLAKGEQGTDKMRRTAHH